MKYYIIAGEASGDQYGALLMRALRERDPHAQFRFWGGDAMAAEGGTPVRHIRDLAIMGFVEVVAHLRTVLGNLKFCKQDIVDFSPHIVIGIDYPGFNLKIERWAHGCGLRTAHYISPNLWAWKKGRIRSMRESLLTLCYILPFEKRFFAENNMPQAVYVGHPLLDVVADYTSRRAINADPSTAFQSHFNHISTINMKEMRENDGQRAVEGSAEARPVVALLPGSRRQELKQSLPLMVQLARRHREYRFVVAGMSLMGKEMYDKLIPADSGIEVVYDQTYALLAEARSAVVCSGTATLETALFGVPQVVCYRCSPVSYAIARAVVSRRIKYISLVNLIADQPVVTELIQGDFNIRRLEREFAAITEDDGNRSRMLEGYATVRRLLGDGGATGRVADNILQQIKL